jgi:hypothetical protein
MCSPLSSRNSANRDGRTSFRLPLNEVIRV